jgi:hypothetical protein
VLTKGITLPRLKAAVLQPPSPEASPVPRKSGSARVSGAESSSLESLRLFRKAATRPSDYRPWTPHAKAASRARPPREYLGPLF